MKISKEARQLSRQLFRLSLTDNKIDRAKVNSLVQGVLTQKPRNYMAALESFQRLLRLEMAKHHAVIESAAPLSDGTSTSIVQNLKAKYGDDLTTEFQVNPELIGGMRIKIGSDVFDGSVRNRLARFAGTVLTYSKNPATLSRSFDHAGPCSEVSFRVRLFHHHFPMSTILQDIESQIAGLKTATTKSNVGIVREVGDGVARIEGLSDVMLNEAIEFPNGVIGLALNLEETEVGAILLGDYEDIVEGSEVKTTGRLLSVPVGKGLLGRVVNALGQPIDGKGPIKSDVLYPVEKLAPGVIKRKSVSQPLQTGIMAVDAMIPIGRGQRELIIGDRATGKTAVALDAILSQAKINMAAEKAGVKDFRPIYSIYVAIGQKNSNVARAVAILEAAGALQYTTVVSAPASETAANQYLAPVRGCRDERVVHGQRHGRADRL